MMLDKDDEVEDPQEAQEGYLSLPARALLWLEQPRNIQSLQAMLSIQSLALALLYSLWQVGKLGQNMEMTKP